MQNDNTLLVLAGCWDDAARALVERWAAAGASLLTPRDLSTSGWRYYPGKVNESMAVTAGNVKAASDIAGVLVRLPWVYEHELGHIALADRAYAAAEMNAFLLTWLSELPCSILNRPTPQCLFGPSWRQEKWIYIAAQLGIPVTQMCRAADFSRDLHSNIQQLSPGSIAVTVVGKRCLSCADQELTSHALRLALAANVELLTVFFTGSESGSKFLGASLWPNITNEEIAEAILAYFARANKDAL